MEKGVDKGLQKQSGGKGSLSRHSLCRLLRGSKAEAESPIHKRGQGQKGESLAISRVSRDRRRDAKRPPLRRATLESRQSSRDRKEGRGFCGCRKKRVGARVPAENGYLLHTSGFYYKGARADRSRFLLRCMLAS